MKVEEEKFKEAAAESDHKR